ncbi:hypothetical protein [Ancylomarina sp. 16SWW S1-10-2]|uniref:hypothetical protein n=1 Tax=Ancylomarina sp. 16SWW S1-10-2 TaxID=2499681 RepID=UPI0012AD7DB2|nr:hypothetical protein [Ancylomarina sp. 16SWW S1-10-2]MRT93893.1 hypothetical protein [Ancylomarina sp. 16SWW S1-10-2]
MNKIRSILYTLATVLIIVGALFIIQDNTYGILILVLGLVLNMVYRAINIDFKKIELFHWFEFIKLGSIIFMAVACLSFMLELEQKFNLLILSIIIDLIVNMKEISFKKKA